MLLLNRKKKTHENVCSDDSRMHLESTQTFDDGKYFEKSKKKKKVDFYHSLLPSWKFGSK